MPANGFPFLHDLPKRNAVMDLNNDMNMVWHNAICVKAIFLSIIVPDGVCYDGEGAVATQQALAMSGVKILLDLLRM